MDNCGSRLCGDSSQLVEEPAHFATRRGWKFVEEQGTLESRQLFRNERVACPITVEARPPNENVYNFHGNTKNNIVMLELSTDNAIQYKQDLHTLLMSTQYEQELLNLLKNKYSFHDETNKEILYNNEINMFAETYNIINACPILAYDNSTFWLKDPNGIIYIWYRTDEIMIHGGCNIREALINFLFHPEKLCHIEEDTHRLISVKEVEDEAIRCYREGKKTAIVVSEESLKLLKKEKEGLKKSEKKKKRQKKKE